MFDSTCTYVHVFACMMACNVHVHLAQFSFQHQIVEFLWTQMKLHHPKGSCEESKGSWAYNDQKWAVCIEKMHRLILKELNSSVKSLKWTKSVMIIFMSMHYHLGFHLFLYL